MTQSSMSIEPDMSRMVAERKRIRQAYKQSMSDAQKLEQLDMQVSAYGAPALSQPLQPLTRESLPPQEVQAILPRIEQEIAAVDNIAQQIQAEQNAIAEIKRKAKNLMIALVLGGFVAVIIIVLLLINVAHI
jgi:hypothetical protein